MSSSAHFDNKKKYILVLGKGPTQGLEHILIAEKMYSINFIVTNKNICLSLHYNGANSYLFVNGTEIYKFKAKYSEIFVGSICLGNISKDWLVDDIKKTGFTGYVDDFSVDYYPIAVNDIKNINKYSIKQTNIKNRTYYFYNDIIDIKNFDATLLKVDKKLCKNVGIYNIGYITSSVFCCSFGQLFIVPIKKISPIPTYTYF